jgi:signal transduction histidine kinase
MKRLSDFIMDNIDEIISEWEIFAETIIPVEKVTKNVLRNHSHEILTFIAKDIASLQSDSQQKEKSHGENIKDPASPDTSAEIHGALRLEEGFDIVQMVSEFRALRASVTRLWIGECKEINEDQLLDLIRFNESIDQALAESTKQFTKNLDASRDLFFGILGHDLRNPLGAISMSAQLLKRKGSLNEIQADLTAQITDSAARMSKILMDLLDVTRARFTGKISTKKQTMNFGDTAQKIVDEMRALHPTLTILSKITGVVEGQGDPARIEQALSNLLANAIQYGQKEMPITVAVAREQDNINLSVHNTGTPILDRATTTIFDSLVRGPNGSSEQGRGSLNLGLGLYITKMIVLSHEGFLSVSSSEAGGTTFTARFPQ